jgi:acetyltransferase EpsM
LSKDKNILLIGTGAQAKYALEIFHLTSRNVVGIVALPEEIPPESIDGVDVVGGLDDFEKIYANENQPVLLFCCSKNKLKEQLETELSIYAPRYVNAVHPTAVIARTATLGHGVIINANSIIQPYARIGKHVMIHAGVIIEHDCVIGNYANLAPRVALSGYVKIGKGANIYTGAVVIPTVEIGEYAVVGAGGVVIKNVSDDVTVVGCPTREIKSRN